MSQAHFVRSLGQFKIHLDAPVGDLLVDLPEALLDGRQPPGLQLVPDCRLGADVLPAVGLELAPLFRRGRGGQSGGRVLLGRLAGLAELVDQLAPTFLLEQLLGQADGHTDRLQFAREAHGHGIDHGAAPAEDGDVELGQAVGGDLPLKRGVPGDDEGLVVGEDVGQILRQGLSLGGHPQTHVVPLVALVRAHQDLSALVLGVAVVADLGEVCPGERLEVDVGGPHC